MSLGGLSPTKPATPEVQAISSQVKQQLEDRVGEIYTIFWAIAYRSQVVAGTNYFIKIQIGPDRYAHLRVFLRLPAEGGQAELTSYQLGHTRTDPITYF
ncbi:cystatin-A-like isoform X2 [Rhineura floridana]|uniref:cystatin-A-like isoform X2 n=1 Tax=Rhineura floridana TaxID=261503 RepID=UPI002AC8218C|nr:cystatin-A-like isoform X2 [Rhineura floridana]